MPGNCLEFQHQRHAGQLDWLERSSWFSGRPPPAPLNGEQWKLMFTNTHHTHACTHICTCTHTCTHACTHLRAHTCTHSNMRTRMHICMYTHANTHAPMHIRAHTRIHVNASTHACMHICMCTHAHAHTHARTYVHTHTNTYLPYIEKKRKERRKGSVLLQFKQGIVDFYRNELSLH